jgi:hypothetical protein
MSNLKIGDMVRLVGGRYHFQGIELDSLTQHYIGKVGVIQGFHPDTVHPTDGVWWFIKLADGGTLHATANCLQRIPGDPEGRQLVRWDQCDWRPSKNLVLA